MRASHPTLAAHLPSLTLLLALPLLCPTLRAQSSPQSNPTPAASPTPTTPSAPQSLTPAVRAGLTIRMLNGKTGKPMRDKTLRAEFQGSPLKLTITIDKQGIGHLEVPPGATAVSLIAATRKDHPDQPAYTVCGPFGQFLPIAALTTQGFVPQNACSDNLHLTPQPGVVFYLIEPLPWYTPATD